MYHTVCKKQFFSINYMQYNALDEYLIKKNVNKISFIFENSESFFYFIWREDEKGDFLKNFVYLP